MGDFIVNKKNYDRGLVGKIVLDTMPGYFAHHLACSIAYLKKARDTLGTEAVSSERMDEIREGIANGSLIGLPVYAYVHGNVCISTAPFSCPWDSGQSGFAYMTKEKASEFLTVEGAIKCIEQGVKTYSAYLSGDVYGYILEDEHGETIEDCWGFYGSDEHDCMMSELDGHAKVYLAKMAADEQRQASEAAKEAAERLYWAERDVVTA